MIWKIKPLETERLHLQLPQPADVDRLASLWVNPQVTKHIRGPRDETKVREHFQAWADDPQAMLEAEHELWWAVAEKSTGEIAGECCLLEKEVAGKMEIDVGYFFLPEFWGKGYATEAARRMLDYAFTELDLDSAVAVITPGNDGSAGVARRLGMVLEQSIPRSDGITRDIYRLKRGAQ